MPRLSILAGSFVLLAFSGVNAGPCRPSSSTVTTSLETTAAPTEVETTGTASNTADLTTTTTAETTTAAVSKCTAAPLPENPRACKNIPNPHMAPNCVSFNIACDTMLDFYFGEKYLSASSFEECVSKCAQDVECSGVQYTKAGSVCMSVADSLGSNGNTPAYDVAYKRGE
ncbi:hypothetical protein FGSG_00129 [Fusarium graminearum PH-1]|uniref:hypothetical protein n=1 Tax=Gibberella zeae (strain ATCC MYA-4620 / CBS 123657 / FGSC 9075 / NRRL 31084 / PH-1) TaxID=229533 RepID=UPI00021F1F79|nr:hypothetical protein FGSG_00129 [Fusarium graminearum PH-1]ESU05246.1 hypothetical protein FGSG_00129 [Fusarium graminearum PH-1]|eukprot:XP_011315731.1 hypothetical protein FGSG_00129 [Fusarium graminearum PH-1]